jgi:hypothetical protein
MVRRQYPLSLSFSLRNVPLFSLAKQHTFEQSQLQTREPDVGQLRKGISAPQPEYANTDLALTSISSTATCCMCLEAPATRSPTPVCPAGCSETCATCMKTYITTAMRLRRWPLPCVSCAEPLDATACLSLLAAERETDAVDRLERLLLERVHTSTLRYCANTRCAAPFDYEPGASGTREANMVRCPLCSERTCVACSTLWHDGPCRVHVGEVIGNHDSTRGSAASGEAQLADAAVMNGWRRCPGCATWCGKEPGGCNFTECICGSSFCWRCMTPYRSTGRAGLSLLENVHGVPNCECGLYTDIEYDSDY